ncbi:MAG: dethiobiotin synthase [Nitrospirae bacterium RBG_13_39_12]|nr:MAG: dethiobiotin synthase [Nitrospirae bacterium RBG_13_39_12]
MAKGFFITGTDTGVGKTVVTAAIIKAIGLLGLRACGMKPIETGCIKEGDVLVPLDGMFLKTIARMEENVKHISPYCFESPLAPMAASEVEGVSIDFEKIKRAYTDLKKNYDAVVVEGIGGLLVPIRRDYFVLDLARDFGLPIIVVSRPALGTLNHTMLTVNYAIKEGLNVAGIIINYNCPPKDTLAEDTNPEIIKQISKAPLIGVFPYLTDMESVTIEKAVLKNLDIEILKKYL